MNGNYDIKSMIKFIVIVLIVAAIFYLITIFVSDKNTTTSNKETEEAVIQFEEIIIGDMYNQPETEYYVLLKDNDDPYISYYETYLTNYKSKDDALKVYYVNLSSAFNKKYLSDSNNIEKDDFKINSTVLIKIKDKGILESYQNSDEITEALTEITK